MQDAVIKILLVFLGALVGAYITRYLMRRRLRALMPIALSQLESVAEACAAAFSIAEAAAAASPLENARLFASEVLIAEINRRRWLEGARLVDAARVAMNRVVAEGEREAVHTSRALRDAGHALRTWVAGIEPARPRFVGWGRRATH